MVRGIEVFGEHFRELAEQYVLIGGAACDLIMDDAGLGFRATKDLDIVLCIEVLDITFAKAFWEFVHAGKYQIQEKETGEPRFYRFLKPEDKTYPYMLELFSRIPDFLDPPEGVHLTPIPFDEGVSSLSAILMDDVYYNFLCSGKRMLEGIPIVSAEYLIPLKAKAWLDLKERRKSGESVSRKDIKKHKNDVFRLYNVIDPTSEIETSDNIRKDMSIFLNAMEDEDIDLKNLGISGISKESIIEELRRKYVHGF